MSRRNGQDRIVLATPSPVTHRTAEENLGLGYLAAYLRQEGHRVDLVDGWLQGIDVEALARRIVEARPSLVGFACYRSNMMRAIEAMQLVQRAGVRPLTVAGGYGPTFHANEFLEAGFDAVVRGEGELPMCLLAEHVRTGTPALASIPGLSFRDEDGSLCHNFEPAPKLPFSQLPHPHRDTLDLTIARRSLVHLQTARGCQATCTFCSIIAFERVGGGSNWRQRSIRDVADEIEQLWEAGARYFKVIDDSLVEPPRDAAWCAELADEFEARGLSPRLRGSIRADRAEEDVVRELARAGFFSFSCGIENFSQSALRRMAKRATVEQNYAALDRFRAHGIYVQAGHILFDDRTTLAELEDNYAAMRRYAWTISKGIFTEMYAAAGTNFTRTLTRRGGLQIDQDALGNTRYDVLDPRVRCVYGALKRWQKEHAAVYDKAIDPLSAPKALDDAELALMHGLSIDLRETDLDLFRLLLDAAAGPTATEHLEEETHELIEAELVRTAPRYRAFDTRVKEAYRKVGLVYDADDNPFLC
ncbi:B12-binding domain-containing radical SAM protein [Streptomyces tardus]|uniref:B12-binding domain-containing radical SAM protein n=1 Tax=Streptomyces tardus TaxID=2780544 RepID=UPI001F398DA4|nr:radical SAM protein [Streptomyces tardus]